MRRCYPGLVNPALAHAVSARDSGDSGIICPTPRRYPMWAAPILTCSL